MKIRNINRIVYYPICLCALFTCLIPLKASAVDAIGWVGPAKIIQIHLQPSGNIYIKLSIPTKDLGCPDGGAGKPVGLLQLDTNATFFKEQYSLLLSAQAQQSNVSIYVDKCGYYPYAQNTVVDS